MAKKSKQEPGATRPWRDTSVFAGGPGQKWTLIAAFAVILVLVGASVAVLLAPRPGDTTAQTPPPATAAPTTTAAAGEEDPGVCGLKDADPSRVDNPPDLRWISVNNNSWPVSDSTGPTKTVDGIAQCFDRSPIGAALAGVNIIQSARTADIPTAHAIVQAQYVPGPGVAVVQADIDRVYPQVPPENRPWGRVMGYKILSFTPDEATVLLVENWPQRGQYTGYKATLRWIGSDWKLQVTDEGYTDADSDITVDPNGFTLWKAAG